MMEERPMRRLAARIIEAGNGAKRPEIVQRTQIICNRVWGEDAPYFGEEDLRTIQSQMLRPPEDGRVLRGLLCALNIPLIEALETLEYWPDLRLGSGRSISPAALLEEGARAVGLKIRVTQTQGRQMVVEFL